MTGAIEVLPDDLHNQALVGNVHPRDWMNPDPAPRYSLVVIGAGTAGLVAAAGAAGLGAKVALVERHLMGGDCLNFGCVPSKGIISAGRVAAAVRDAAEFGVDVPEPWSVDFGAAMLRKSDLSTILAATNEEIENPLWHGEVNAIKKYYEMVNADESKRVDPKDVIFLATHEPCPLCASAITGIPGRLATTGLRRRHND